MRGITTPKTPELNQKIIDLYKSGISGQNIATKVHVSTKYVRTVLRDAGFQKGDVWRQKDAIIIDYYKKCNNFSQTAEHFKISRSTLSKILKLWNMSVHVYKHQFNYNIFDTIDTEEKAYWLGFIYADGCILEDASLIITLSIIDKEHLVKFNTFMQGSATILKEKCVKYNGKEKYYILWQASDKHLKTALAKCGVFPKKSLVLTFPSQEIIPQNLMHHFIRGIFDGDGSISTIETSCCKLSAQLIGTEDIVKNCLKHANIEHTLKKVYSKNTNNLKSVQLKIANSIKFFNYIYKDATIYLDRKYNLWQHYCRSNKKLLEELEGKFGKDWDVNSEVIKYLNYTQYRNA